MNKIFSILLLYIFTGLNAQVTVVVADFENNSGGFDLDYWENAIPGFLTSELSKSEKVVVVERNNLDKVLEEQALGLTGLLESQNIGNLIEAQFIIQGTINRSNGNFRIDANIIKVESGETESIKVIAPDNKHLEEMIQLLGNNIKNVLVGQGSYIKKIQLSELPTTYFAVATAGLAVTTILLNNAYVDNYNQYKSAIQLSDFDSKYDKANNMNKLKIIAASLAGVALAGTIYCWISNMSANEILASKDDEIHVYPILVYSHSKNIMAGFSIEF